MSRRPALQGRRHNPDDHSYADYGAIPVATGVLSEAQVTRERATKNRATALQLACAVAPVLLAATTYQMGWKPKEFDGLEPYPLTFFLVAFWATVAAMGVAVAILRQRRRLLLCSLLLAWAVLLPFVSTSLTVTRWWLQGIPQAEMQNAAKRTL